MSRFWKSLLFYPLFMFRRLVRLILGLLTAVFLLFVVVFLIDQYWLAAILTFVGSIVCVALRFNYAVLLLKLNPSDDTGLFLDI